MLGGGGGGGGGGMCQDSRLVHSLLLKVTAA